MEFELKHLGENVYSFEYVLDGRQLAEIHWILQNNLMIMDHTVVSDELRGQGVAKKLLDTAAHYARENNYKMKAVCSYVAGAFVKSDAYDDVKSE